MVNEIKYGVISDIHQNPENVPLAIDVLKNLGAEKLLINGDIGNQQKTLQDSQNHIAFVLDSVGKSKLESIIQPGSHESMGTYSPVMDYFSDKFSNIIDATKNQKIEQAEHDLVFLPGTDFSCGGEYIIGNDNLSTGTFIKTNKGLIESDYKSYFSLMSSEEGIPEATIQGLMHYSNMKDLKKLVTHPEKTIMVCHVPRKFDNLENAVDMAYFAEKSDGSVVPGVVVEDMVKQQMGDVPCETIKQVAKENGFDLKYENRGNEDLKNIYEELGITKAVSGHFHDAGHRANNRNGNHVLEGKLTNELFWNSGCLDSGQTGILTVKGNEVSYQNINLQDYVKK